MVHLNSTEHTRLTNVVDSPGDPHFWVTPPVERGGLRLASGQQNMVKVMGSRSREVLLRETSSPADWDEASGQAASCPRRGACGGKPGDSQQPGRSRSPRSHSGHQGDEFCRQSRWAWRQGPPPRASGRWQPGRQGGCVPLGLWARPPAKPTHGHWGTGGVRLPCATGSPVIRYAARENQYKRQFPYPEEGPPPEHAEHTYCETQTPALPASVAEALALQYGQKNKTRKDQKGKKILFTTDMITCLSIQKQLKKNY